MVDWLLILLGLVTLLVAADLLVRGSVWIALTVGLSPLVVGLTLVAFGTSAPELFVGLAAGLDGRAGVATGNALGSNVANIGLIVGLSAILRPIEHPPAAARFEVRFLIGVSALVLAPLLLAFAIDWAMGALLVALLVWFTSRLIARERRRRRAEELESRAREAAGGALAFGLRVLMVAGGLAGLTFGADWLVAGASAVASELGMSDVLIGATIVAIGTSLPELATSLVAARKGHSEIALGNVLGSNVFNICMVLGVTSLLFPLPMRWDQEGLSAIASLVLAVVLGAALRARGGVGRVAGTILVVSYAAYMTLAIATDG